MKKPVDLELAKKLKAEGYSRPCNAYWLDTDLPFCEKGLKRMKNSEEINHNEYDEFIYSAPPQSEAISWLVGKRIQFESSLTLKLGKRNNK